MSKNLEKFLKTVGKVAAWEEEKRKAKELLAPVPKNKHVKVGKVLEYVEKKRAKLK